MSISQDTAIVTVDSLAAAFQHFNITHITASEFFRFITEAGDGREEQAATARGAVIPVCMYLLTPSSISPLDDRQLSLSEIAHLTKDIPTSPFPHSGWDPEEQLQRIKEFVSHPTLPFWVDAETRLKFMQQCKKTVSRTRSAV